MPPSKKRKTNTGSAAAENAKQTSKTNSAAPEETETTEPSTITTDAAPAPTEPVEASSSSQPTAEEAAAKAKDRMARFKALKARAKSSSDQNFKEATLESQRLASDPSQLTAIHRKQAIASQKLLKADVEDAGGDFERKRAWDWTIDESEKWDKHVRKKEAHRDNNAFQDYTAESNKVYKRQLRNIAPDMEKYEKDKMAAIERAAASGGLDIVETEDGELIAVDKDGSFYSTADSTTFAQNKPDKAAVDRLVEDLRRAEENRLKKRKDRMAQNGDDGDVTYINEKNKQFNQKLARFYNKYTAEIRDSFERGTMI
ncbi:SYF2 splicing factor [Colletotrichum tofieldiae]|uniref:Pre-mRNA-splicing factor SYF2 n=2 Tax=Colletotrichum spaethianum species complex TaxID=2707349 RepID=A0A166XZU6_9PEZI|nr:SYF2 splicing factor [Colletotrichum tofieldiae]GJC90890.1 pre-mRNA-splicing factor SYF2 [Colletotrichum liriopes]GKT53190.1 SYF2 splicing factor [Colletotrichum tofieldiae]GKT80973.1 SYF2 splicing factor [Colletotrichum tofieldiae]GKT88407.1 SYF2 splicing factor [Colletotrichum tofieldiae]